MDMFPYLDLLKNNPLACFFIGVVFGFYLRHYLSTMKVKRPSRYQSGKSAPGVKKTAMISDLKEPTFDLSDNTVKSFAARTLSTLSVEQSGNEV
jgi:hypothetical protein